jgi:hypothetical protein
MNPEEKVLLERTLKLSEENNKMLRKLQRTAKWAVVWGFVKVVIIVIPLVAGYFLLQPYFGQAIDNFNNIQELFYRTN